MTPDSLMVDLAALGSVILIDLVLAGDNAVVIGMTAGRLAPELRRRAIAVGVVLAVAFRIAFAAVAVTLMQVVGLLLLGGLLLLWVAWKLWRDLRHAPAVPGDPTAALRAAPAVGFWSAIVYIAVADISMSLDNVLAVAGTARHNLAVMAVGLALSIALMGFAASAIARLIDRHAWLNTLGIAVVAAVALMMIWDGAGEVLAAADAGRL